MRCRVAPLAAPLVVWIACGTHQPAPPPPPTQVPAAALSVAEVVETTEYLAQLRSRTAPAIKPQVDGQIVAIFVRPGDLVQPGTPLLRIDPARQTAAVAQSQAAAASRRAALELAQRNLARVSELVARGALPQQELDNARAATETARADLAALGAELRGNQVQLGYYQITAPTRGIVGDIPVRVGDRVTSTTQVTSVTDLSALEANVAIPVDRARDVKPGTEIRIFDDSGNQIAAGGVTFIAPEVNPETQAVLIKADIDNRAGALRADQIVRARVVWRTRPGIAVPALAVSWVGGQPFVFVVETSGPRTIARQRPVQLGELGDRSYPVVSGLREGERVVTGGIQKLRDGAAIAVKS